MAEENVSSLDPKLPRVLLHWALSHPRRLLTFMSLARSSKRAKLLRDAAQAGGLMVPPFLMFSITARCNLRCAGCYAAAAGTIDSEGPTTYPHQASALNTEQWRAIISEARELGVFYFVMAGGEPFLFPGLLELCSEFRDRAFLIFTNGTVLTESDFRKLRRLPNVAVLVSIEGGQDVTDARRGPGVYERASHILERLAKTGVPSSISVTITVQIISIGWIPKNWITSLAKVYAWRSSSSTYPRHL